MGRKLRGTAIGSEIFDSRSINKRGGAVLQKPESKKSRGTCSDDVVLNFKTSTVSPSKVIAVE